MTDIYLKAVSVLMKGLTGAELLELHSQIDGDPHETFNELLAEQCARIYPEEFTSPEDAQPDEKPSKKPGKKGKKPFGTEFLVPDPDAPEKPDEKPRLSTCAMTRTSTHDTM